MDIRDWVKEDICSGNDFQRMMGNVNKPDSSSNRLTSAYSVLTLYKKEVKQSISTPSAFNDVLPRCPVRAH